MITRKVSDVSISLIKANPGQPRKIFEEEDLLELKNSIQEYGVLQPIILKKNRDGTYGIIAGERRFRAASLAGLEKIPAVIKNADEKDAAFIALVENIQRENLSYIEEAYAYRNLIDEYNLSQGEIAQRVGKTQSTISNKIRILSLPADIQKALLENKLTERHARALLKIQDAELQRQVLKRIITYNLNVRQSERLVDEALKKRDAGRNKRNRKSCMNYKIYVNSIRKLFTQISEIEKDAQLMQEEKDDFVEVKILIPKKEKHALQRVGS